MVFAAAHVHPFVVAWLSRKNPGRTTWWAWGGRHYGYLLLATMIVTHQGGGPRRGTGVLATAGGVLLDRGLGSSSAAPWFAPVYYVKLLTGHAAGAALVPGRRRS